MHVVSSTIYQHSSCRSFHCHFGWIVLHREASEISANPAWPRDLRFCMRGGERIVDDCKQGTISLSTRSRTRQLPQREQRSSWLVLKRTKGSCKMVWGYSEEAVKMVGIFGRTFGYPLGPVACCCRVLAPWMANFTKEKLHDIYSPIVRDATLRLRGYYLKVAQFFSMQLDCPKRCQHTDTLKSACFGLVFSWAGTQHPRRDDYVPKQYLDWAKKLQALGQKWSWHQP